MKNEKKKKEEAPKPNPDGYSIGEKQMDQLIYDLSKTIYWQAVVKYTEQKLDMTEVALYSYDPFKQPTETARAQGMRQGLLMLVNHVMEMEERMKNEQKDKAGM